METQFFILNVTEVTPDILTQSVSNSLYQAKRTQDGKRVLLEFDRNTTPVEIFKAGYSPLDSAQAFIEIQKPEWQSETPALINNSNQDSNGAPIVVPTFEYDQNLNTVWKGYRYQTIPGVLNIFDELVIQEVKLRGGWYEIETDPNNPPTPATGDYLEFAIIDKDDVLGLFTTYGLVLGQDLLELGKFVQTDYVNRWGCNQRKDFNSASAFDVVAGLYFRTYYRSMGVLSVDFCVNMKYLEA